MIAGAVPDTTTSDLGCPVYILTPSTSAEITQASQDPVCDDDTNSDTRFTFSN